MALSPVARYAPGGLLHAVPPPPMINREPSPIKQDVSSDNDGTYIKI